MNLHLPGALLRRWRVLDQGRYRSLPRLCLRILGLGGPRSPGVRHLGFGSHRSPGVRHLGFGSPSLHHLGLGGPRGLDLALGGLSD